MKRLFLFFCCFLSTGIFSGTFVCPQTIVVTACNTQTHQCSYQGSNQFKGWSMNYFGHHTMPQTFHFYAAGISKDYPHGMCRYQRVGATPTQAMPSNMVLFHDVGTTVKPDVSQGYWVKQNAYYSCISPGAPERCGMRTGLN